MVCRTNLKENLDKVLEARTNIPDYVLPKQIRTESTSEKHAANVKEEVLEISETKKVVLFANIPLFSENAPAVDKKPSLTAGFPTATEDKAMDDFRPLTPKKEIGNYKKNLLVVL